jgi:two-component system, NarL family, response regulator NreC
MSIRILIADDHGVMRAGLRALLEDEPGIEVVGEAADGKQVLKLAKELLPDIVLLDIGMPVMDGIETTRQLKQAHSEIQVLILSLYEDEKLLREAIKVGAAGYVIKRAAEDELLAAIKSVSRGDMYIHPAITRLLVSDHSSTIQPKSGALESLTPRELEVMGYLIRGYTNRQIAEALFISIRTVESHRASLLGKLALRNRVELVEFAKKYGLMDT